MAAKCFNVGQIGLTPITWHGYVGTASTGDDISQSGPENVDKFNIDSQGRNINITLRNIAPGQNATLQLYRDVISNPFEALEQGQGIALCAMPCPCSDLMANQPDFILEGTRFTTAL